MLLKLIIFYLAAQNEFASSEYPKLVYRRAHYLQSTWESENVTDGLICALSGDYEERAQVVEIFNSIEETNLSWYMYENTVGHYGQLMTILTENPHARINAYLLEVACYSEGKYQTDEASMDDAIMTLETQEDMDAMKSFYLKSFKTTAENSVIVENSGIYRNFLLTVLQSHDRFGNASTLNLERARKMLGNYLSHQNDEMLGVLANYLAELTRKQLRKFSKSVATQSFWDLISGDDDISAALRTLFAIANHKLRYLARRFDEYYEKVRRTDTDDWKFYMSPGALIPRLTKEEIQGLDRAYRELHGNKRWITGDIENGYQAESDGRVKKMLLALMGSYLPPNCPV